MDDRSDYCNFRLGFVHCIYLFLHKSKSENKLDKVANILGAVAAACFGLGAICNFAMYFLG